MSPCIFWLLYSTTWTVESQKENQLKRVSLSSPFQMWLFLSQSMILIELIQWMNEIASSNTTTIKRKHVTWLSSNANYWPRRDALQSGQLNVRSGRVTGQNSQVEGQRGARVFSNYSHWFLWLISTRMTCLYANLSKLIRIPHPQHSKPLNTLVAQQQLAKHWLGGRSQRQWNPSDRTIRCPLVNTKQNVAKWSPGV